MIETIFVISASGEVLIEKHWYGKIKRTACEVFLEQAAKYETRADLPPVIATPKFYLIHIFRYGLSFLAVVKKECPPLLVVETLNSIVDTFLEYFARDDKLTELAIRENFSLVYQVLDEMIDGGFPSTMELNQLKEMIVPPSMAGKVLRAVTGGFQVLTDMPKGALSKIPWRRSDVKYVTNEIYFDVIEAVDCVFGENQMLESSNVYGSVRCNCQLSDMPDLTLNFTKPSLLDDVSLHRCVRIHRFQREKTLSFVPPDGKFTLMTYRVRGTTKIPIYVRPNVTFRAGGARIHIMVGTKGDSAQPVTDVAISIPLPKATLTSTLSANVGTIKQDQITKVCRWVIGKIPNDRTPELEGSLTLPPEYIPDERPTLTADFAVKVYSASGLKVEGLAIRNVKYKPFKGVRILTKAGKFEVRT